MVCKGRRRPKLRKLMPSAWILVAPKVMLSMSFDPLVYQKPNYVAAMRPASFRPRFAAAQMLGEQRHHENPGQAETDG